MNLAYLINHKADLLSLFIESVSNRDNLYRAVDDKYVLRLHVFDMFHLNIFFDNHDHYLNFINGGKETGNVYVSYEDVTLTENNELIEYLQVYGNLSSKDVLLGMTEYRSISSFIMTNRSFFESITDRLILNDLSLSTLGKYFEHLYTLTFVLNKEKSECKRSRILYNTAVKRHELTIPMYAIAFYLVFSFFGLFFIFGFLIDLIFK